PEREVIPFTKQLHLISTGQQSAETFTGILQTIHEYVDRVHIREKNWTAKEIVDVVQTLIDKGVPQEKIIINDRIDIAYIMQTIGVQLTHHSADIALVKGAFPSLQIGCSTHSVEQAILAEEKGANYLFYGHIFNTQSKPGIPPRGLEKLQEITSTVKVPVIAIGGITPENTGEVIKAGARGIAVLSGVLLAKNPIQATIAYRKSLEKAK